LYNKDSFVSKRITEAINKRNVNKDLDRTLENNNFAENNDNEQEDKQDRTEAGMDNKGRVGEGAIRELVGEQPQGDRIFKAIANAYASGSNRAAREAGQSSWSKERFLGEIELSAKRSGAWIDDIYSIAAKHISKGQENEVYIYQKATDM
jgi:hypothetical protein